MENRLLKQMLKTHEPFDLPPYLARVTAGRGGEAILIFAEEATVLHDCGMAYCNHDLIKNIAEALRERGRESLDLVLLSHTHYDHVGALPYVLKRWPHAQVYGAEKAKKVFQSEGARKTMKRLGEAARNQYSRSDEPILTDGLRVDRVVKEGDEIVVGENQKLVVIETKGHTDCSLSFLLQPEGLMFTSESTGIPRPFGDLHTSILKDYHQSIEAAEKCKAYQPKQLLIPHYGLLPVQLVPDYFDIYMEFAEKEKDFVLRLFDEGLDFSHIMKAYEEKYWSEDRSKGQPKEAFLENANYIVRHLLAVFRNIE